MITKKIQEIIDYNKGTFTSDQLKKIHNLGLRHENHNSIYENFNNWKSLDFISQIPLGDESQGYREIGNMFWHGSSTLNSSNGFAVYLHTNTRAYGSNKLAVDFIHIHSNSNNDLESYRGSLVSIHQESKQTKDGKFEKIHQIDEQYLALKSPEVIHIINLNQNAKYKSMSKFFNAY